MSNNQKPYSLSQVRQDLLKKNQIIQNLIPPTVTYTTEGNLLIIGAEDLARNAASKLKQMNNLVIVANDAITNQDEVYLETIIEATADIECFYNKIIAIKGFLGQFQVTLENTADKANPITLSKAAIRKPHFDIILDLSVKPFIQLEMLPPGYFYVGQDQHKIHEAISQIPSLIGEFDKPRYVKVNQELCAHHRNGINGCNRCLSFCPADAITSVNHLIEIDPYLCHGAGSCANACPTAAIGYELPTSQSLQDYLKKLIQQFQQLTQVAPVILFHDSNQTQAFNTELAGDILPIELEEIAVAGIEHWMAALAWGARQVLILQTPSTPATLTQMLIGEIELANSVLTEIGDVQRIALVDCINDISVMATQSQNFPIIEPADFFARNKRQTLFDAIDYLNSQQAKVTTTMPMANVPYGKIEIASDNCTLCLSCVATCPTSALNDGGDKPALYFTEQNCVQCGLCESACPEKVITLTSQINFSADHRAIPTLLKQEQPFECIICGTPFATQSMVNKMLTKVGEHSAFNSHIDRLKMCGDCRVKDMFVDILQDPEKQLR